MASLHLVEEYPLLVERKRLRVEDDVVLRPTPIIHHPNRQRSWCQIIPDVSRNDLDASSVESFVQRLERTRRNGVEEPRAIHASIPLIKPLRSPWRAASQVLEMPVFPKHEFAL